MSFASASRNCVGVVMPMPAKRAPPHQRRPTVSRVVRSSTRGRCPPATQAHARPSHPAAASPGDSPASRSSSPARRAGFSPRHRADLAACSGKRRTTNDDKSRSSLENRIPVRRRIKENCAVQRRAGISVGRAAGVCQPFIGRSWCCGDDDRRSIQSRRDSGVVLARRHRIWTDLARSNP